MTSEKIISNVLSAINVLYRDVIDWLVGVTMQEAILDFKAWCDLLFVHSAIDCTHVSISKPPMFPKDYHYFKTIEDAIVLKLSLIIKTFH